MEVALTYYEETGDKKCHLYTKKETGPGTEETNKKHIERLKEGFTISSSYVDSTTGKITYTYCIPEIETHVDPKTGIKHRIDYEVDNGIYDSDGEFINLFD